MEEADKNEIQIHPNHELQYWISCTQFGYVYSYGGISYIPKKKQINGITIIEVYEIITPKSGEISIIQKQSGQSNQKFDIKPDNQLKYWVSLTHGNILYSKEIKFQELNNILKRNHNNFPHNTKIIDIHEIRTNEYGSVKFIRKTIDEIVKS
jgi:hypothetical protein